MANVPGGPVSSSAASLDLETDVLILGGGLAGTWAAIAAATGGARTILADKGFCGTSGATAASGTTLWYVDPDPVRRAAAKASREGLGGHLAGSLGEVVGASEIVPHALAVAEVLTAS